MRKTATTINPALSRVISETGHTDLVVVTDAGLPIPPGSERIDLAYRPGAPEFLDVLDTVLAEMVVEGATVSAEVAEKSPEVLAALRERFAGMGFEIELIPHVEFKKLSQGARAFVRSGEFTPYANVILHAGVAY
ncbi:MULTISPECIES: D-ribose pyranase [Microbacterium]|uniref:D-ribose pyranase n=1 Tax=Microbacterium aurugineum TaxID=2851642 RepID=A0ABY4IV92_9MICO|nr:MULTISPECIES: D-ribose pyranase [Microbacterium]PKQ36143.1 MAG: D-ribose pyranase [Actinobacteria bacterium HGW-Actinobacteria-11]MCE0509848.1 D-ribose pyranase [Microbacterium sp. KKR3/1]MCK8468889.1 D-ribose pyranase [Microbacterium aurugineum]QEA27522.1 D-ribose pyranase [Microbacterium sp. CBA3102]TCJ22391.1 D-ribose pyranase [Microbacterium sp. PI-1]